MYDPGIIAGTSIRCTVAAKNACMKPSVKIFLCLENRKAAIAPIINVMMTSSVFGECIKENKTPVGDGRNGLQVVKILEQAKKVKVNHST